MGQMYEEQKKIALLSEAFSYFYAAINIGSAIATLALPRIRDGVYAATGSIERGYAVALTIPAGLMVLAFSFFALGKKHYPVENVRELPKKTDEQRARERATLTRISGLFALIALFWFVYDQAASTWIYFAKDHMDLHLAFGISTTPDQIQGLNPVLVVALTPVFNALWDLLKRRRGAEVPDTRKMLFGFVIVVACMAIMSGAGFAAGEGKVSVWWLCLATLVITLSELCISVIGLELAFKVAAPGTKSVVTAAFLFTVTIGNFIATAFDEVFWGRWSPGLFFAVQAAIMAVTTVLFFLVGRRFEQRARPPVGAPVTA
jgi:POT family proton-dependent oligopeptide transporter